MGGNVDLQNKRGNTPLHCNILYINKQILQNLNAISQLNESKVNINVSINLGISVAAREELRVVETLLNNEARIDIKNQSGKTPSHLASKLGLIQVTNILLNHQSSHSGSDKALLLQDITNMKDNDGKDALYYAHKNKNWKLMKLLKNHGGDTSLISADKADRVGLCVGGITFLAGIALSILHVCSYFSALPMITTGYVSTNIVLEVFFMSLVEVGSKSFICLGASAVASVITCAIAYAIIYKASEHSLNSKLSKVDISEIEKHNSQNVTEDKNQHNESSIYITQ